MEPEIIIIEKKETTLQSIIRDSYTLITQLIFLGISLYSTSLIWSIFALIALIFALYCMGHNLINSKSFTDYDNAFIYLKTKQEYKNEK